MEQDTRNRILGKLCCYILILFLSGCDIPGKIVIKNTTNDAIIYKYYQKSEDNTSIDTLRVMVPAKSEKYIVLGFGQTWTESQLKSYSKRHEKIELIKANDTIVLKSELEIYQYFKNRIRGLHKDEVEILIE